MLRRPSTSGSSMSKLLVEDGTDSSDTTSVSSATSSRRSLSPATRNYKENNFASSSSWFTPLNLCKFLVIGIALHLLQLHFAWGYRECHFPSKATVQAIRAYLPGFSSNTDSVPKANEIVKETKVKEEAPKVVPETKVEVEAKTAKSAAQAPVMHEMEQMVEELARVWQPYNAGNPLDYCISNEQQRKMKGYGGILYAKLYKTGSTTGAAATLHIAHRVAERKNMTEPCKTQVDHPWSTYNRVVERAMPKYSVLWSSVRKPDSRALSAYYFYRVGHGRTQPKDESIIKFMGDQKNNQFVQLRTNRTEAAQGMQAVKPEQQVDHLSRKEWAEILRTEIMHTYDFLAVTERMEESLVVLKLLWGLKDGDIILYPGKTGEWSHDWTNRGTCFRTPKSKTDSPVVWDWIESEFKKGNADYLLYQVVDRSLDRTIEAHWGKEQFQKEMAKHNALRALVLERCEGQAIFPCSETGEWQDGHHEDCYMRDIGCGYRCVDKVLDEYESGKITLSY